MSLINKKTEYLHIHIYGISKIFKKKDPTFFNNG